MGFYDAEKIGLTVGTIFLIPASVSDIRQRSVSRRLLIAGAAAAVSAAAFSVITGNRDAENVLLSLFPGALLLLSSRLTEGKVGIGDGCSLLVYGTAAGAGGALLTSAAGLFLTALTGLVLMAVKKAEKDTRLPFLPFCLAASVGVGEEGKRQWAAWNQRGLRIREHALLRFQTVYRERLPALSLFPSCRKEGKKEERQ